MNDAGKASLTGELLELRELLHRVGVGLVAVEEPHRAHVVAVLDLLPQRLARIGVARRVVGGDVVGQKDLALHAIQIDVA